MKNFLKMFLTLIVAVFILGAGLYVTLANVSFLLAKGKPHWECRWVASGLLIKTGIWSEVIDLRPPLQVTHQAELWILRSQGLTITVNTKPKFRVLWKRSLSSRKSLIHGEY
jgi:hypothetical protein